jgi:glycosyltransferase involved in cell wall biosynthesis
MIAFQSNVQENKKELCDKGLLTFYHDPRKVAIVMPYYNDKAFITKSVGAILGQTFKNWRLFLVDDGSKQGFKASHILGSHPKIFITEKQNEGPSKARNVALQAIRNDPTFTHVAFCDSDDVWAPNYLKEQLAAIGNADVVYCSVNHAFENGEPAVPYGIPDPEEYPGREVMLNTPFYFLFLLY